MTFVYLDYPISIRIWQPFLILFMLLSGLLPHAGTYACGSTENCTTPKLINWTVSFPDFSSSADEINIFGYGSHLIKKGTSVAPEEFKRNRLLLDEIGFLNSKGNLIAYLVGSLGIIIGSIIGIKGLKMGEKGDKDLVGFIYVVAGLLLGAYWGAFSFEVVRWIGGRLP